MILPFTQYEQIKPIAVIRSMTRKFYSMFRVSPINDWSFGVRLNVESPLDYQQANNLVERIETSKQAWLDLYYQAGGLMVIKGLQVIEKAPELLVRLSYIFGNAVEDVTQTLTSERFFHDSVAEILVLSNDPPCEHAPPPPGLTEDGQLSVQFPAQKNWHTDQSYRRPPPDVSLLFAIKVPPDNQGQTLYADCFLAYRALDSHLRNRIEKLSAIHAPSWIGRSRQAVQSGQEPLLLLPHQQPQHHPLVRRHPITGEPALYICEENQLDYVDGPVDGLEPGPGGEGAKLIEILLRHSTQPSFVYEHRWQAGDLVIGDNRSQLHCATWYDADRYSRLMWRTTVSGDPGAEYAGEAKSWVPVDGSEIMSGMEGA